MAGMEISEHIAALRLEGERVAEAAGAADPDAPVPTCPGWVVRDVVRHLGGVHRWATGIVSDARTDMWDVEMDEVVGSWPADAELVEWFRSGHAGVLAALSDASPDLACWAFLPAPSPLAFWARRQAHETAIHRIDAERAAGTTSVPFAAALAADGIDELLSCFITRPGGRLTADPPRSLQVQCSDAEAGWLLSITPEGVRTSAAGADAGRQADCNVSGRAADLYEALWNRRPVRGLDVAGDPSVLQLFCERVHIRWS